MIKFLPLVLWFAATAVAAPNRSMLRWEALPPLPEDLGVAGPLAGIHHDALIVAGGANFPRPVWQSEKVWRDSLYVLELDSPEPAWIQAGNLPRPLAYGAAVSTPDGIVCMGGNES